jgi:phosphatidylinositol alpha-1,6-mannosyltransferase
LKYYKNTFLIVTTEFPPLPGGIGNHAYHLANELLNEDRKVIVLTEKRANSKQQWQDFCNNCNFEIIGLSRNIFIPYTYIKRIIFFLFLTFKYQPITFFSGKFSIWLSAINISKNNSFAIIHGSEIKCKGIWKKLFQKGLNKVTRIISVSNYTQNQLFSFYKLQKQNCIVINNGFYLENSIFNINKNKTNSSLTFITVGGMHLRKGQQNFIKCIPELIDEFGKIKYIVAGIPQEIVYFKELASSLDILDIVEFLACPSDQEIVELLTESDIFIMLSENLENGDFEGFGIAILEAMSMGLPAIGSKNTGIEDAISNEFSGILVNHGSVDEIKNAVITIKNEYDRYSKNAIEWSQKFRWSNVILQYEVLLK